MFRSLDDKDKNFKVLEDALGEKIEILTPEEINSLKWLSGWELETIENIANIIKKVKEK